jgi:hypothetical protein
MLVAPELLNSPTLREVLDRLGLYWVQIADDGPWIWATVRTQNSADDSFLGGDHQYDIYSATACREVDEVMYVTSAGLEYLFRGGQLQRARGVFVDFKSVVEELAIAPEAANAVRVWLSQQQRGVEEENARRWCSFWEGVSRQTYFNGLTPLIRGRVLDAANGAGGTESHCQRYMKLVAEINGLLPQT